jgi:hypothetical protein
MPISSNGGKNMRRKLPSAAVWFVLALAALGLACSSLSGVPSIPGVSGEAPAGARTLLEDDFSDGDSGWGTGTDEDSAVEYEDGVLRMKAFREFYFTWSTPNEEDYKDVHLEVTANNESGDKLVGFGVLCNQQVVDSSFHYFAVTTLGEYAIARAEVGKEDLFLTNSDDWTTSDSIPVGAGTYQISADCGAGALTLYVNGVEIDSVSDPTFTEGSVGLFIWSAEEPSGTISFDDFVMTALE